MFSALTSPSLLLRLFLDFHAIPSGSSIFLLIRQVIWPSPGTLVPARLPGESWTKMTLPECGPWEWGLLYRGLQWEKTLVHTEVCRKYTKVLARETPVYYPGNIKENWETLMKTCKLWGLRWKLENFHVTGTPVKIWKGVSSNFVICLHGSKRESRAPKPWYIFGKPLYVPRFFPTVDLGITNPILMDQTLPPSWFDLCCFYYWKQ